MKAVYIALMTILLIFPNLSQAQLTSPASLGNQINSQEIILNPEAPQPNKEFSASLSSVEIGAEINWTLNGEVLERVKNQRNIELVAGEAGEDNRLIATIITSGQTRSVVTDFTPLSLDIIIEPQTYSPRDYRGRSLPSEGSQVNATAILSGKDILPTDLVYRWEIGRNVISNGRVRGLNKVSFEVPKGNFPLLSLEVRDLSGKVIAKRLIAMPSVTPSLVFYEKSLLYGMNELAIDNTFNLVGETALVEAVPYHLDSRVYNGPDIIEWKINQSLSEPASGNPYEVNLQKNTEGGTARLNFHVRSRSNLIQGARDTINIRF